MPSYGDIIEIRVFKDKRDMTNIKVLKDTMDIPYFTLTAEALTLQIFAGIPATWQHC
jgi:hypothetical protein